MTPLLLYRLAQRREGGKMISPRRAEPTPAVIIIIIFFFFFFLVVVVVVFKFPFWLFALWSESTTYYYVGAGGGERNRTEPKAPSCQSSTQP